MYTQAIILLASVLSSTASASCIHNTSLKPRAEGEVPISNFGYTGTQGPFNWAGLDVANVACSTSQVQSPINIDTATAKKLSTPPTVSLDDVAAAEFENLGTTVEVLATGTTMIGNQSFNLAQFHFHTPSEHRIDEEYFPLEMHMVHEATSGDIAVIAVMFQLSSNTSTELLKSVTKNIDDIKKPGTVTETGALDFAELQNHIATSQLFTYTGSLTTPPCAEGLTFIIPQQPMALDVETFNAIKSTVKFNSRYTQNGLGSENILELGCDAAESARNSSPVSSTAAADGAATKTAIATESAAATETAAATTGTAATESPVAKESATTSTSTTAVVGDVVSETPVTGGTIHCIAGACHERPARMAKRSRWTRWAEY